MATCISLLVVIVAFRYSEDRAEATHTLPGIETIVASNGSSDPYVILEVVESKTDASLGYLVGGEEPIFEGKSIKDFSTEGERISDFPALLDDLVPAAYDNLEGQAFTSSLFVTNASGAKSVDIKGSYINKTGGHYQTVTTPAVYIAYDPLVHLTESRYDLYIDFNIEENSSYVPVFQTIGADMPDVTVDAVIYKNYNKFEIAAGGGVVSDDVSLSTYAGSGMTAVYEDSLSGYIYRGKIVTQADAPNVYILSEDGTKYIFGDVSLLPGYSTMPAPSVGFSYQALNFEGNALAGTYYISSFQPATLAGTTNFTFEPFYLETETGAFVQSSPEATNYVYDPLGTSPLEWYSDYSLASVTTYSYDGGFDSAEWLKKNVFDREDSQLDGLVLDIKTVTMDELNLYNLDQVDFVYFAGVGAGYASDLQDAQAIELFTKLKDEQFPILMNRSVFDTISVDPATYSNMVKLSSLLIQTSYDIVDTSSLLANWTNAAYWLAMADTVRAPDATYGYNYVNRSFYMYDDTNYSGGGAVPYVNANYLDAFSTEMVDQGFEAVLDEIKSENFYLQMSGYSDVMPEEVTKATAMRYIINYGYKRNVIKSRISVLEIEPCYSYGYTDLQLGTVTTLDEAVQGRTGRNRTTVYNVSIDRNLLSSEYIAENWATQFRDNPDRITLTQTYSAEFIGRIEDLNESYDLIYIGLDTSTMNSYISYSGGAYHKTSYTLYNNAALNGLIYQHSGDYVTMTDSYILRGLLNPEDVASELSMPGYGLYAFAGNDITLEKYNALCEYLDAGYPIVFADGFYNVDANGVAISVNTSLIDRSSYMYKIAKYAMDMGYFGQNVNVNQNIVDDTTGTGAKETLANYLNISKLSIELTTYPTVYDGSVASPAYLAKTDGDYILEYQFRLKDDSAVMDASTSYNIQMYIDSGADGRFYSDEEITGLKVYELKNGVYVQVYQTGGRFQLLAGKYYKMVREVPTGYVGVLPWKVVLTRNDNLLVRKSKTGYTAIATPTTSRETIKVLQLLATTDYASNNWNLQTDASFNTLLDQVQDFDIQITSIPVSNYIQSGTTSNPIAHFNILDEYDMLVIGFSDGYSFTLSGTWSDYMRETLQANAALAIRQYISEGRSVLFTHDTTSYINTTDFKDTVRSDGSYLSADPNRGAWDWGYDFNRYVRDIVGMDRFGVLRRVSGITPVNTVYDSMWVAGTDQSANTLYSYSQGYSNQTVAQYGGAYDYVYNTRPNVSGASGQYGGTMYVTKTNEGQITRYPFDIPEKFAVTNTHRQYYQLNLDTDSKDDIKDDDIVVWYCISDVSNTEDIYQTTPNDVRNNYYIYNKGNVTYSGVGHSTVTSSYLTEMKLFVNTMVAAYNAGLHPPKVTYRDGADSGADIIENIHYPYDEALGQYIVNDASIYFEVADTSFAQGTKDITAVYYMEVETVGESDLTVNVDGESRYLKEFVPSSVTNTRTNQVLIGSNVHDLDNNEKYVFTLTTEQMQLLNHNRANIYVGVKTTYTIISGSGAIVNTETQIGYYNIEILKTQLFELE